MFLTKIWHGVLLSVLVRSVSGAARLCDLQLHGWTPVLWNEASVSTNRMQSNITSFSKHRPSGPMLSISQLVRLCVCLCVRPCVCSLLRYRLNVFLPPLPEVGCPIFLEIRNPWGKVMERSGLTFEHFCLKVV